MPLYAENYVWRVWPSTVPNLVTSLANQCGWVWVGVGVFVRERESEGGGERERGREGERERDEPRW